MHRMDLPPGPTGPAGVRTPNCKCLEVTHRDGDTWVECTTCGALLPAFTPFLAKGVKIIKLTQNDHT
jgi:hypothetical protein